MLLSSLRSWRYCKRTRNKVLAAEPTSERRSREENGEWVFLAASPLASGGSAAKILRNLSTGRFRGNGNFIDQKSLGRERRRSRQNINVKQLDEFCGNDVSSKLCSLLLNLAV